MLNLSDEGCSLWTLPLLNLDGTTAQCILRHTMVVGTVVQWSLAAVCSLSIRY